jgi:hypothetical protein
VPDYLFKIGQTVALRTAARLGAPLVLTTSSKGSERKTVTRAT